MAFASEILCAGVVLLQISFAIGEKPSTALASRAVGLGLSQQVFRSLMACSAGLFPQRMFGLLGPSTFAIVQAGFVLFVGGWIADESERADESCTRRPVLFASR